MKVPCSAMPCVNLTTNSISCAPNTHHSLSNFRSPLKAKTNNCRNPSSHLELASYGVLMMGLKAKTKMGSIMSLTPIQ